MATKRKKSSNPNEVRVDFGDTESRGGKKSSGGRKHYPEGDYPAKVKAVKLGKSGSEDSDERKPRIETTYVFTKGKLKGKEIRDDYYLTEKALWRLRQALEAMGIKVPSKAVNLDITKMKGKECALTIADDEYDGKAYSVVTDVFMLSELEDDDEDEDDDLDEDDEDEDEDDDEDDDEEDDDEDDEDDDDDEVDLEELDDI